MANPPFQHIYPSTIRTGEDSLFLNFTCYDYKSKIPGVSNRTISRLLTSGIGAFIGDVGDAVNEVITNATKDISIFGSDLDRFNENQGFSRQNVKDTLEGARTKNPKGKKGTVSLYLPPKLESKYSADWQKMQFGVLGSGFNENGNFNIGGVVGAAAATGGSYLLDLAKSFLDNTPQVENLSLNGLVGATLGISFNDNTLQTFNKMNPRTFEFEYIMIAKSETDVENMKAIIRQFKRSMHPSAINGSTGIFLGYPYIWRITPTGYKNINTFSNTDQKDQRFLDFLPKTDLCALVDMKVDYSPDNNISLNTAGFVQAVRLSLSFTELSTLTREDIEEFNY